MQAMLAAQMITMSKLESCTWFQLQCGGLLRLVCRALLECLDGGVFVIFNVEHSIELGDLQQVLHLLSEI
jgi:hypothetical protein